MYRIQFLFITIILIVLSNTKLNAQLKVKDSSEKKQPDWIHNPEQGNIVSKGFGKTKDEAKSKAIDIVKKNIKENAIKQMVNENNYFKNVKLDEHSATNIFESTEYYTNIKAENSTAMYWEFILDKKTKKESYNYFLKYPFNPTEIDGIVQQVADSIMSVKLDTLQQKLSDFSTIEELNKVWLELMSFDQLIPDEYKTKAKSERLLQQAEATFNQIEIIARRHVPGKLIVYLILNERVLETPVSPTLISDCAKILETEMNFDRRNIVYSYDNCSSTKPLSFKIEFDFGLNKISKDFEINTANEIVEVKISNRDLLISNNNLTFFISSRYRANLIVEKIVIQYNDVNFTNTPMHQVLDGAGLYDIRFNLPPDFHAVKVDERVRGELHYKTVKTGQKGVCRFYNHPIKRQ